MASSASTKPEGETLFQNPPDGEIAEIEVIDPAHPLFGRRYQVAYFSSYRSNRGYVAVVYQGDMRLNIPRTATQLSALRQSLGTKLTLESVTEFVTLAQQYEVLCQPLPPPSGTA